MDQMNNAALYHSSWKDGTGSIFKPTDSIHGDEANVLHATGLDFIKDLHPGMLAFRFVDPQAQDIFVAVFVITQNDIDSLLVDGSFGPHENVNAVYEQERVEWLQRPVLPFMDFIQDAVRDMGDLLMGDGKAIDILNSSGNIPLAHATSVHGQDFSFKGSDIPLMFLNDLRFKGAFPIARNLDGHITHRGLHCLLGIFITSVSGILRNGPILRVSKVVFQFSFESSFENGGKNLLQCRLDFFQRLRFVRIVDCLANFIFGGEGTLCHSTSLLCC